MAIDMAFLTKTIKEKQPLFILGSSVIFNPLRLGKWQGVDVVLFETNSGDKRVIDLHYVLKNMSGTNINF